MLYHYYLRTPRILKIAFDVISEIEIKIIVMNDRYRFFYKEELLLCNDNIILSTTTRLIELYVV